MAVGVKPTISGYKPAELGHLAILAYLFYHTFCYFAINIAFLLYYKAEVGAIVEGNAFLGFHFGLLIFVYGEGVGF